jgi:hypothetical protein
VAIARRTGDAEFTFVEPDLAGYPPGPGTATP